MNSSQSLSAHRFVRHALMVLAVLVLAGAFASVATACPTCSQALADQQEGDADIVAGFFWSIIFMMSMPFILLSSFSGYMYLEVKKARAAQTAANESHAPSQAGRSLSQNQLPLDGRGETTSSVDQQTAEPAEVSV